MALSSGKLSVQAANCANHIVLTYDHRNLTFVCQEANDYFFEFDGIKW